VGEPLDRGVPALNTFLTVYRGQLFGLGRRQAAAPVDAGMSTDISVIGLVGECGREVQEFLRDDLGAAAVRPPI
jgi:flagellum-specific ATP synthase